MDTNNNAPEDARVSIGVAIALWGTTVVGAAASGLFEKFAFEETIALAAFSALFALATYFLDASVRAVVDSLRHRAAIAAALGIALAFGWPNLSAVIFVLPLATVFAATALTRREAPKVTSTAAKSPGARPAAT